MSKEKEPFITPVKPALGQNAASVVVNRDDGKGGAKPIAETPGVVPDYPFQGTPAESEPVKKAPDLPGPTENLSDRWTEGGVRKAYGPIEGAKQGHI